MNLLAKLTGDLRQQFRDVLSLFISTSGSLDAKRKEILNREAKGDILIEDIVDSKLPTLALEKMLRTTLKLKKTSVELGISTAREIMWVSKLTAAISIRKAIEGGKNARTVQKS